MNRQRCRSTGRQDRSRGSTSALNPHPAGQGSLPFRITRTRGSIRSALDKFAFPHFALLEQNLRINATHHTTVSQRIERFTLPRGADNKSNQRDNDVAFLPADSIVKERRPRFGTPHSRRDVRLSRAENKNPALSAGPIRHTWTNSRVAQLMSTLGFVADLAFSGLCTDPCPQKPYWQSGSISLFDRSSSHLLTIF